MDLGTKIDEMLRAVGRTPLEYKGWRTLEDGLPAFRGVLRAALADHPTVAQADFEVMIPGGAIIVESYGVVGPDADARAASAIDKLAQGVLRVVLAATDGAPGANSEVEAFGDHGWASAWQLVAYDDTVEAPGPELLDALRALVEPRLGDGAPHWCSVVRSQISDTPTTAVLWDNERWPEAEDVLHTHEWPARKQTCRRFILVAPGSDTASEAP